MNMTTHPVAPEEIMAWLDGEMSSAEAQVVSAHLKECAECAALAEQLREISRAVSAWRVPEAPVELESSLTARAAKIAGSLKDARPVRVIRWSPGNWRLWAIGCGGAAAAVLILATVLSSFAYRAGRAANYLNPSATPAPSVDSYAYAPSQGESLSVDGQAITDQKSRVVAESKAAPIQGESRRLDSLVRVPPPPVPDSNGRLNGGGDRVRNATAADSRHTPAPQGPMIARTVSMTILARNFASSRAALDAILARHRGYAASLTVNTPADGQGSFQASLRIPADEIPAALGELKTMGRVLSESQSGEEVTQQHADLVARLANSREEEQRLRTILEQRTGKIEDVLQVEEEIARVRGEIESMEGQQKALEHRVDFVTVDLQLTEEYKAQLDSSAASASTRVHNAFVAGIRNASGTLLAIVLFFEEYGPPLLIWLSILGLPVFLAVWRYRKMRARI